jgi:uncharacterized phage protein gp47/JayE
MAIPPIGSVAYPTPDEILNQLLTNVRFSYDRIGVTVNVSRGSELYIRMKAVASRVSIAIANNEISLSGVSPLDAAGETLTQVAGVYGVSRREASSGSGNIIVSVVTGVVTIPADFACTAPDGIQYKTISSVTVPDGAIVAVSAVSAGSNTDQKAGTVITWDSAAIGNLNQDANVDPGGIDGGSDEDDDEALRERLIQRLSFPAEGGNWAQVAQLAENASSAVEAAFVYPAVRGPSSYDVALTKVGTDRQLSIANVNYVATAILAEMPGSADLNCTSVEPEYVDVIVDSVLPLPVNAGGAGGGWRDPIPWPSSAETLAPVGIARITAVNLALSQIDVDSTAADPPKAGDRFGIWNPTGGSDGAGSMAEFAIQFVTPFPYTITIDTNQSDAISFIQTGMYCSAGAVNLKGYSSGLLKAIQGLGPGEKSNDPDIIPRALRNPGSDIQYPTSITTLTLCSVTNEYSEVLNMVFAGRFTTGTFVPLFSPTLPPTTVDAPRILVLNNLAFRRLV